MKSHKDKKNLKSDVYPDKPILFLLLLIITVSFSFSHDNYCWVRYNQAGYMPHCPKYMVVMAEKKMDGKSSAFGTVAKRLNSRS